MGIYSISNILESMRGNLYFYHLVPKDANISLGLISPRYMYEHRMYNLFDNSMEKYIYRIQNSWGNGYAFKDPNNPTRKEIIDGLKRYRGKYALDYIYFFRYPPTKDLGKNMETILEYKDIYRIDLNDPALPIKEIFWGYWMSNSDNRKLTRKYYEEVSEDEYFMYYNDNTKMNFAALNHIGIAFKDGYCPYKFLTKIKNG